MSVYTKLSEARARFHALQLKKTGENKFAGYKYFELGDFLIPALQVFKECGLLAHVSFTQDIASMTITDLEDGTSMVITSPMGSAALKGCHEVQNIGAVETYQRRYLWVAALEIVEHDALDAVTGSEKGEPEQKKPKTLKDATYKEWNALSPERKKELDPSKIIMARSLQTGADLDAWNEYAKYRQDEEAALALWSCFNSAERAALKAAKEYIQNEEKEAA